MASCWAQSHKYLGVGLRDLPAVGAGVGLVVALIAHRQVGTLQNHICILASAASALKFVPWITKHILVFNGFLVRMLAQFLHNLL